MTVLPTVRRQIEQAAQRQASPGRNRRPAPWRPAGAVTSRGALTRQGPRLSAGSVMAALGVAVALAIVVTTIALLGHRHTARTSSTTDLAPGYRLNGDGIGAITFGDRPDQVVTGLKRLLGLPAGANTSQRPNGLVRSICGFDDEIDWVGLAEWPTGAHSAGLTIYFRDSRFVGYSYGPLWGDRTTPLVRHGVMLSTGRGLGLDEPLARARRLYGPGFLMTLQQQGTPPNPQLERLPAWQVRTATGLIYGYIDSRRGPNSAYNRTIGTISAGSIPNTPCRAHPTRSNTR